jgi:hypothetical protein
LLKGGTFVGLNRIDVTGTDVSAAGIEALKRGLRAEVIS